MGRYHEGRQKKATNVRVACGERIVDPSAANEEAPRRVHLLRIGQGPEAMGPEAQFVEFRAGDTVIADQPCWCTESYANANEREDEDTDTAIAGKASFLHREESFRERWRSRRWTDRTTNDTNLLIQ